MPYYSGFLLAVPTANRDAYRDMAASAWEIFKEHGCLGAVETWGVDVPDGSVTSFPMAVKKTEDETVVFSWMVWPDKATADKGWDAVMADPRMKDMPEMPFDGMRMMWGGFEPLFTAGTPA
ncbi:hypothetical protein ROJ8625_02633 [Roseivivax jejudonensis]|uniref:RNA signal recognition particle n=1 Tax=Roseivivax jejudonensis TaxID=1529041 RepID=A0A1X6ZIG1_9RHOB|nr:DUF1428 domain-containing protein [Roseivivax jejudonensis]SLN52299.1 hypothetical protein ROJ8625_02633 [Roseivivax jejudonensis]